MNFFTRIAMLFYVTLVLVIGCFGLIIALNLADVDVIQQYMLFFYGDENLRIILGSVTGIILFMNFMFYQMFSVNTHKEKIIAFDNPSGRVSVSLYALEDLVKRMLTRLPEIKDVRAGIKATKKGLQIRARLVLKNEVNIPELTSKLQEMVKNKVHDTIGLDEPVNVAIYIGKILPDRAKEKQVTKEDLGEGDIKAPDVPFQGYRA